MGDIRFRIDSLSDWSGVNFIKAVMNVIKESDMLVIESYGEHEPTRKISSKNEEDGIAKIWEKAGSVSLAGNTPFPWLLTIYSKDKMPLAQMLGSIDEKYFYNNETINMLINFVKQLFVLANAEYGSIYHEKEYAAENMFLANNFVSIIHCIPGLYWINIFGQSFINYFSLQFLESCPHYKYELLKLNNETDAFILFTANSPKGYRSFRTLLLKLSIKKYLGKEFFFNKYHPFRKCNNIGIKVDYHISVSPIPYNELVNDPNIFILHAHEYALQYAQEQALDFSKRSLLKVNDIISNSTLDIPNTNKDINTLFYKTVAYYGEVFRKLTNGKWEIIPDHNGQKVPVITFDDGVHENVVATVLEIWGQNDESLSLVSRLEHINEP